MTEHIEEPLALKYANQGNGPLLDLMPPGKLRVLDVGCGAGDNARLLTQRGCSVVGITASSDEAAAAGRVCERVVLVDLDAEGDDSPELGRFDVLLFSHVLEHLRDPAKVISRLAKYLVIGGHCLIAVPNMGHWRVRLKILRGDWSRQDTGAFNRTHLQFWSMLTATSILDGTPFELVKVEGANHGFPLFPLRRIAPKLCGKIDSAAGTVIPNFTAGQILLVAVLR
ncbi:MAG: class I SAM-dependent methyltransferase [Polyangiaceae bacterium]